MNCVHDIPVTVICGSCVYEMIQVAKKKQLEALIREAQIQRTINGQLGKIDPQ